jgi:hypothetical protein
MSELVLGLVLLLGGKDAPPDLATLIDANAYFQARNLPVSPDKLADLAAADPKDGKTQIAQLLALRKLAEDAKEIKQAKNFGDILRTVEEIAAGQKAQDPQGFAADYARRAALALGSDKVKVKPAGTPEEYVRRDALAWFPASAKLVGAISCLPETEPAPSGGKELRELARFIVPRNEERFFDVADKLGNLRLDRFAVAYTPDLKDRHRSRIYFRFTGKGDPARLLGFLKESEPALVTKEQKGFRGQRITLAHVPDRAPGYLLIGDSELIIAGFEGGPREAKVNQLELVEEMLAVRAGKGDSALTGKLAGELKKLPAKAAAVAAGELPEPMRENFTRMGLAGVPTAFRASLERSKAGATLHWEGRCADADAAAKFNEELGRIRKLGLEFLKEKKELQSAASLTRALESIKTEVKGTRVTGTVTVPREALQALPALLPRGAESGPLQGGKKIEEKDLP